VARALLKQTQAMTLLKQSQPERYAKVEQILTRSHFDPKDVRDIIGYWGVEAEGVDGRLTPGAETNEELTLLTPSSAKFPSYPHRDYLHY